MAGGHTGGEWWRVDGPWRVFGRARGEAGGEADGAESVYAPEVPVQPPVALRKEPPTAGRGPTVADFPGWDSVEFDFPGAAPAPVPDQRAEESVEPAEPEGSEAVAEAGPERMTVMAGRRPSLVVLLAALALLAGALTGQLLAMLVGWGVAYVAPRLSDPTRKFAVLGLPLIAMTGSAVWYWGRVKGRWGSPLASGAQLSHETWAAAPGVLRLAAALSALFLLAVTLRRRPE